MGLRPPLAALDQIRWDRSPRPMRWGVRRLMDRPLPALVLGDGSPRHTAECQEGRGFSPAMENGLSLGALEHF